MGALNKGIRYTAKALFHNPAVTAGAVLALGMGAGTAVFRLANAVPVEPLPFREPPSAAMLKITDGPQVSPASYPDWKSRNRVFGDLAAVVGITRMNLTGAGEPRELVAGAVTADFFQRIGVRPAVGRAFLPGEDQYGRDHVVILSHRLWRRFGGDRRIIGKSITLNGESHQVVGILPPDFTWNNRRTDVWVPYMIGRDRDNRAAALFVQPRPVAAIYE